MDDYRYLKPDNATRSGRRCNGIVSYDTLGDPRQLGARADLLRLRYYPPRRSQQRSSDTGYQLPARSCRRPCHLPDPFFCLDRLII